MGDIHHQHQHQQTTRPASSDAPSDSIDALWRGIEQKLENIKASGVNGRLSASMPGQPTGHFNVRTSNDELPLKPGYDTGLSCVPSDIDTPLVSDERFSCTQENCMIPAPLPAKPSLETRAEVILGHIQQHKVDTRRKAAELFLAGPLAWPDYPDYEDVDLEDEPIWEPLPPK